MICVDEPRPRCQPYRLTRGFEWSRYFGPALHGPRVPLCTQRVLKVRGSDLRTELRISSRRAAEGGTEGVPGPTGMGKWPLADRLVIVDYPELANRSSNASCNSSASRAYAVDRRAVNSARDAAQRSEIKRGHVRRPLMRMYQLL